MKVHGWFLKGLITGALEGSYGCICHGYIESICEYVLFTQLGVRMFILIRSFGVPEPPK